MPDSPKAIKHQDLVYDVGLHRGEDTAFYLAKGFRVVAVEADPQLASECRGRFHEFIAAGRLIVAEGAIVDPSTLEPGQATIRFYKNLVNSVWGTTVETWKKRNEHMSASSVSIDVPILDFGALLRTHGIPRYMKVDIEGCDILCLRALEQFEERPDYVSIESDKTSLSKIREELSLLKRLGYSHFQAVEQSEIPSTQFPPKPAREGNDVDHRFEHGLSGLFGAELPGKWKDSTEVLRQYAAIRFTYYLVGDDGVITKWKFRGASLLRKVLCRTLGLVTRRPVPGWYDTHGRHLSATHQIL